jgi:hypothetical protein
MSDFTAEFVGLRPPPGAPPEPVIDPSAAPPAATTRKAQKRKIVHHYEPKRDQHPYFYLSPESRVSPLARFVDQVQGASAVQMKELVKDWLLLDGTLTMDKLSGLLQESMMKALQVVAEKCQQYKKWCPTEQEIIDDPGHPYYLSYVDMVAAYVVENSAKSTRQVHTVGDRIKHKMDIVAAQGLLQAVIKKY